MSVQLDKRISTTGTKFLIYAQARHLKGFEKPEEVVVSVPPGEIQPGPADERMFVVNAIGKKPYGLGGGQPQWQGKRRDPVKPNAQGHFHDIDINSDDFSCATMYATVRRVLDIWEDYVGEKIPWFSALSFDRLELIPLIEWDNAQSGRGFLEFGFARLEDGGIDRQAPYCRNFDVLAHELGHNLLFSLVGLPHATEETAEFGGFHESGGDLTAIVAVLHFNSVVDHLLDNSKGNLFTVNELSRVGELPKAREIRVAFNYERMSTVSREPHDLSLPLTGAIFDIFVEVFQKCLVRDGLIRQDLADRSNHEAAPSQERLQIDSEFAAAYHSHKEGFKQALLRARDYLGKLLATTWKSLTPNGLTYSKVALAILQADHKISNGENAKTIRECFAWREIGDEPFKATTIHHAIGSKIRVSDQPTLS